MKEQSVSIKQGIFALFYLIPKQGTVKIEEKKTIQLETEIEVIQ